MSGHGIRVLHADDEPGFAEIAAEFVHRSNSDIQVTVVTSGAEALDTLEDNLFDCVVSDFDMPEMNGIELLEHVREIDPDLPFVLFTGKGSEDVASHAISKGVSDYLQKEGGTDQYRILANRIANLVRQYRAETELVTQVEQQRVTAKLDEIALSKAGLDELFEQAVELVATTLDNEFAKVLEYHPEDNELLLCAGVGWQDSLVGQATVGDGADSQAGHTLRSEEPIIVSDLDSEERFRGPALLTDHDVRSGISVVIGDPTDPWGVFGTHSTEPKTFTADHVTFIQNVANILGSAIKQNAYEQRLERSKARFNAILDHTETPMFMKDDSGAYLFVNQAYRDLFELEDEAIIGRTDHDIHPAEMADEVSKNDQHVIETGEPLETEEHVMVKGDERIYRSTKVPIYDTGDRRSDEQPVAVFGVAQDITEQRTLQEEIEASEERLRVALDAGELGMWELDLQSEESPVRSFRHDEIFGYQEPVEEWSFERFLDHVHPGDREMVQSSFENGLEDGHWTFTSRIERIDGVERWITAQGLFFYDEADEPRHAIGIVEDVTEKKVTEQELREKTERLEEFVRMVSHDIKNPLSVASGRLELYYERGDEDDLTPVDQALTRIEEITTDLTALARFGESELDSESVSLEKTALAAWEMIDTRDAQLEVEAVGIVGDGSQLQGIFENLFKNAVGHGGSDVTVRVGGLTDGFFVEDTGTGIPPDIRDQVFESGFTTGYSGSGIGLSIVSRIVEAHGWSIELTESAEGGARFEITGVEIVE